MLDDRRLGATAFADHTHATAVTRKQGAFAGCHGYVEIALCMLADHRQRPGNSERHLDGASEVLDVATRQRRINRVARHRIQLGTGHFCYECGPLRGHLAGIVIVLVAGNSVGF